MGSIAVGFGKPKSMVVFAGGASAATDRGEGSTAASVSEPEGGCECIQQCPHGSLGRSKAMRSSETPVAPSIVGFSLTSVTSASGAESLSIPMSLMSMSLISW